MHVASALGACVELERASEITLASHDTGWLGQEKEVLLHVALALVMGMDVERWF